MSSDQQTVEAPTVELRDSLKRLAADPANLTLRRLWGALTAEEKEAGISAAMDDSPKLRATLAVTVAGARHFRTQTVLTWDNEKIAKAASHIDMSKRPTAMRDAIEDLHMEHRAEMLADFMEAAGIPHDGPRFLDEDFTDHAFPKQKLERGADVVAKNYPLDEVVIYLLALCLFWPIPFAPLQDWIGRLVPDERETPGPVESQSPSEPQVGPPSDVHGFTTLDRRIILTLVDAAAGIDGALNVDEVDDLILELLQLNAGRHQTFFHAGYCDALFKRAPGVPTIADNDSRRQWYWAGYINGIARRNEWVEIAQRLDTEPAVRELGGVSGGAGSSAAWLIAKALCETERYAEVGAFVTPVAIAASGDLRRYLLSAATRLIRTNRAADARPMLDVLWQAFTNPRDDLAARDQRTFMEVKRRRALCLRQLGDSAEARRLLDELAQDRTPWIRAVAVADIGMLNVGLRQLGDLRFPPNKADVPGFIQGLERGAESFRTALEITGLQLGHANFALGVLELGRNWQQGSEEATAFLERAYSHFATSPDVYGLDGTLQHCRLYLGIAIVLEMKDAGRLVRACDLIRNGLKDGATLPGWLAASTIDALSLARSDLAQQVATDILTACGDDVLDEVASTSAAAASSAVREALFARATDPSRGTPARAADCRTVLPWLLGAREPDKACTLLEFLEACAIDDVGRAEFLELMASAKGYSPAWDADRASEARVRILEAEGRFEEAAGALESWCQRLLASDHHNALDHAALLLQFLHGYGAAGVPALERLQSVVDVRLAARDSEDSTEEVDDSDALVALRILVVGGDERQAKLDSAIQAAVRERWPLVEVRFLHSGWSSNWSSYVDEFKRQLPRTDGVVLLAYMRTEFGRTVRSLCHVPWRGCSRGGQKLIVRRINAVIPAAVVFQRARQPNPSDGAVSSK